MLYPNVQSIKFSFQAFRVLGGSCVEYQPCGCDTWAVPGDNSFRYNLMLELWRPERGTPTVSLRSHFLPISVLIYFSCRSWMAQVFKGKSRNLWSWSFRTFQNRIPGRASQYVHLSDFYRPHSSQISSDSLGDIQNAIGVATALVSGAGPAVAAIGLSTTFIKWAARVYHST